MLLAVAILSWLRQAGCVAKTLQGPDRAVEEQLVEVCATKQLWAVPEPSSASPAGVNSNAEW